MNDRGFAGDHHSGEYSIRRKSMPSFPLLPSVKPHSRFLIIAGLNDAGPFLDAQAKAEYKCRLDELRQDLEEAERFNDPARAAKAHDEMDGIARQLAAAVGLGGRDRRASSEPDRARSAATKRIKEAIHKIAARIKTGYFCSYSPHPDRPVVWKF